MLKGLLDRFQRCHDFRPSLAIGHSHNIYYGKYEVSLRLIPGFLPFPGIAQHIALHRNVENHSIECRFDMVRQIAAQRLVIQLRAHVGQDRLPGPYTLNPGQ